jgi:hypothetical protein
MIIKGTCEIACMIPLKTLDGEAKYNAFFDALELICRNSGKVSFKLDYGIIKPKFYIVDECKCQQLKNYTGTTIREYKYLLFNFQVRVLEKNIIIKDLSGNCFNREESISAHYSTIINDVTKCVKDMFFVLNLASLGKMESGSFVVYCKGYQNNILNSFDYWDITTAVDYTLKTQWPDFGKMDFLKAWKWLNKKEWFITGFGGGNMGRAILGLMHSIEIEDGPSQLFWILLSIEALYTKGKGNLLEQVREKSQAFLGGNQNYNKLINRMYEQRSRFIHGDIDFPGPNFLCDAANYYEKYDAELYEAINCARAILIASLRKIITLNWGGISFSYKTFDSGD